MELSALSSLRRVKRTGGGYGTELNSGQSEGDYYQ